MHTFLSRHMVRAACIGLRANVRTEYSPIQSCRWQTCWQRARRKVCRDGKPLRHVTNGTCRLGFGTSQLVAMTDTGRRRPSPALIGAKLVQVNPSWASGSQSIQTRPNEEPLRYFFSKQRTRSPDLQAPFRLSRLSRAKNCTAPASPHLPAHRWQFEPTRLGCLGCPCSCIV